MRRIKTLVQPIFYASTIFSFLTARAFFANPEFWKYRDDSVIHLSHARNFRLFGSVGLSAGDRTEAMSSPLNYLISQLWFLGFPNTNYQNYLDIYVLISVAVLSTSWMYLLFKLFRRLNISTKSISAIGILVVPLVLVSSSWTIFGWLISGMENALVATLLFCIIGKALSLHPHSYTHLKLLIFLFGITRIELAILVAPLMIYLIGLKSSKKEQESLPRKFWLILINALPILVGWIIFHLLRFLYFGSILPNTATALGKSASVPMISYLIFQSLLTFVVLGTSTKRKGIVPLQLVLFLLLIEIFFSNKSSGNFHLAAASLTLILLTVWIALFPRMVKAAIEVKLLFLISLMPINEYFLFGPARLSEFRIVGMFIPAILVLGTGLIVLILKSEARQRLIIGTILLTTPIMGFVLAKVDFERNLCCAISPSDKIIFSAARHFNKINNLPFTSAPIFASPDLGKVSFSKIVMNVDLGLIGDPLLSRIALDYSGRLSEYVMDYVSPDLLQTHGPWSCRYESLLKLPEFQSEFRVLTKREVSTEFNVPVQKQCFDRGAYTIWIRDLPFRELSFAKKLLHTPNPALADQIKSEIKYCNYVSDELTRCQYVYRGVLRIMKRIELSDEPLLIAEAFRESPTYELDKIRLLKDPGWANAAFKLLYPTPEETNTHSRG
jgi:hypothetical protein